MARLSSNVHACPKITLTKGRETPTVMNQAQLIPLETTVVGRLIFTKTKMRILIVDGNTTTADVVRFNLERHDMGVVVAHDGNEAWLFFQTEEFDCVIVDHTLPGIDGHELCENIRSVNPDVPLILLTGRMLEPAVMEPYERLNIVKAIPKPFSPREIVAVVKECVKADGGTDKDSD